MAEQPDPKLNDERPIFEYVEDLISERRRVGRERYKTPLQPGNGRDFGKDADEEMADWLFYWVGYRIENQRRVQGLLKLVGEQATKIKAACEALERIMTGGNHLASALIGKLGAKDSEFPPYTSSNEDARKIITDPDLMDMWICWKVIMHERAALRVARGEESKNAK